jgi:hypothetical protein
VATTAKDLDHRAGPCGRRGAPDLPPSPRSVDNLILCAGCNAVVRPTDAQRKLAAALTELADWAEG